MAAVGTEGMASRWARDLFQHKAFKETETGEFLVAGPGDALGRYADFARTYTARPLAMKMRGARAAVYLDTFSFDRPKDGAHVWVSLPTLHAAATGVSNSSKWYRRFWQQWAHAMHKEDLAGCHMRRAIAVAPGPKAKQPENIQEIVADSPQPLERVLNEFSVSIQVWRTLLAKLCVGKSGGDTTRALDERLIGSHMRWQPVLKGICSLGSSPGAMQLAALLGAQPRGQGRGDADWRQACGH